MPGALKYVPPNDKWRSSMMPSVLSEKTSRQTMYTNALKYYRGEHVPQLEFEPEEEPDDNVVINLVKTTADRTAQFLFPEMPHFETDKQAINATPEEIYLDEFFEANGGLAALIKMATRGFLSGHNFVRVKPPKAWEEFPHMVLLDPLSVTVWWRADDQGDILWYEFRYAVGDVIHIQDFVNDPENKRWLIYTYRSAEAVSRDEVLDNDMSLLGVPGPYGMGFNSLRTLTSLFDYTLNFELVRPDDEEGGTDYAIHTSAIPPIVDWAHLPDPDNYYGQGEANNLDLQDTINRIWSEINRIVREHSDPLDVVAGADIDDIKPYGDNLLVIGQAGAKAQRLEFKGDLSAAVETVNKLVETFLAIVRVVILKGEAKDLQRVTNASVRTLFVDMLAKNAQLQAAYGAAIVKISRLALLMSGKPVAAGADKLSIKIMWASPLPVDLTEVANINALALNGGYRSKRTAATELGDDWTEEKSEIEGEHEEAMKQQEEQLTLMSKFQAPAPAKPETPKPGTNPRSGGQPGA